MSLLAAIPLFAASLAATLTAAQRFARRLDRLGMRFGLPEALIGLLTALAADGPEISSAVLALLRGADRVSVGILVGSNAFNLAAMIGLSGLLAGGVRLAGAALVLEGLLGSAITVLAAAVLLGWLAAPGAAALTAGLLVPYLVLVIGGSELLLRRRVPKRLARGLARALAQRPRQQCDPGAARPDPIRRLLALGALDVGLIIAGSAGMVQAALTLGDRWQISRAALGLLVLAPLTSIPNAFTGVRLGLAGRGAALVGETFNSNTINLAAGVLAPALFTGVAALGAAATVQLAWLVAMTGVCLALLARPRGMGRAGAGALILLYGGFVATQLVAG